MTHPDSDTADQRSPELPQSVQGIPCFPCFPVFTIHYYKEYNNIILLLLPYIPPSYCPTLIIEILVAILDNSIQQCQLLLHMLVYPAGITIAIDLFTHTTVFELLLLTFLTAIIFSLLCNYPETASSPTCRFETMGWFSPFLYVPFYLFAIYAFIFEKEWIRVPGIHTL